MWAGTALSCAARATAAAWLPLECVTTPRAHSSGVNEKTALHAPLTLKDPLRQALVSVTEGGGGIVLIPPLKVTADRTAERT